LNNAKSEIIKTQDIKNKMLEGMESYKLETSPLLNNVLSIMIKSQDIINQKFEGKL
jgi:hypothetical protein